MSRKNLVFYQLLYDIGVNKDYIFNAFSIAETQHQVRLFGFQGWYYIYSFISQTVGYSIFIKLPNYVHNFGDYCISASSFFTNKNVSSLK
jgi:hypothetical protein